MKIANTKIKKTILIVSAVIVAFVVIVILLISPIAKYLLEKYDVKLTGRQITAGWVYVNLFTGYVHISDLKIYEYDSLSGNKIGDSVFFSAKGVSANFAMFKLLSKTIELSSITLDHPKGIVIQNDRIFNFTDIIHKFTPKKPSKTPSKFRFSILDISILEGEFHYHEELIPINYFIKMVNIKSTGKRWNSDTIAAAFSLLPGIGSGDLKGNFTINFKTVDYRFKVFANRFDLHFIEQYVKDFTNNGCFTANLDAEMDARGNFTDAENITASGQMAINELHFGKSPEEDFASFDKLSLGILEISPKKHKYLFDSVTLNHPYFRYERYDHLDNLQMMFGEHGASLDAARADQAKFNLAVVIARWVKELAKNFFQSNYSLNRLAIYNGDLRYNDFAVIEQFSVGLNPLNIVADSIDKSRQWVGVDFKSGIKPYGIARVTLRFNPNDSTDFDLNYHLQKIAATMLNPYLITYTSFPLDRGTIEVKGTWRVRNGVIQSNNHLLVIDPRRTDRVRRTGAKWLPLPLIMALVRERGNVIDYDIPITGNLKDPKFHLRDVLVDMLKNIFVKPSTTHYRMEVKTSESEIEKSLTLKWKVRQNSLVNSQEKFIHKMVDFLISNPEAMILVYPMDYTDKEKEQIGFFEAKKKHFLFTNKMNQQSFSVADSERVVNMSVKDSLFDRHLRKQIGNLHSNTSQGKCKAYVGSAVIDEKFNQLNKDRKGAFMLDFISNNVGGRVKFQTGEKTIPYNGYSYYKIVYKGELPESLRRAYRQMNEFNDEAPRKKYKKDRKRAGAVL